MKHLFRLLLTIGILFTATYLATPLWLPYVFAMQLPAGWQLEELEAGYPGVSGARIARMRVSGALQAGSLEFAATDLYYRYKGLKVDVDSVSLDVFLPADNDNKTTVLTLDDLSLPVTKLTGKIPELSVRQLRLVLHPDTEMQALALDFQAFNLIPGKDKQVHLSTVASVVAIPEIVGQLDVDLDNDSRNADIIFRADEHSLPWLSFSIEQTDQAGKTTTRLQTSFDAEQTDQISLDSLMSQLTGGRITQLDGSLDARARFSGDDAQHIEQVSLDAEQLKVAFANGELLLDAELYASRAGEEITVKVPVFTDIQYLDNAGTIDGLLASAIPELKRSTAPFATAHAVLGAGSSLVVQAGQQPSFSFSGDIDLELTSDESNIHLKSTALHIEADDLSGLKSVNSQNPLTLDWVEQSPLTYTSNELELKADQISLSSSGSFSFHDLTADFSQAARLELLQPMIRLIDDSQTPTTTIDANHLSIDAELTASDGVFLSTGSGTFLGAELSPQAVSADRLALSWQDLDLLDSSGKLTTSTQGFAAEIDAETWSGFDFDISYTLLSHSDINGAGAVRFDSSLAMPIEFNGNVITETWNITLPATTIELAQLGELLAVAQFEMPGTLKLTDGFIDVQGGIVVTDEITAKLLVKGSEMAASLLESSVQQASFAFNTSYANSISAKGPVSIAELALAGGVDVTAVGFELNLENPDTFSLEKLHAEVFDGQLSLEQLKVKDNNIENTTVALDNISLGRLLAFVAVDGLSGTGSLQMSLPLGSDQNGAHIEDGSFHSVSPGRLVYKQAGIASSNIGLQALENFHYQDLSGTINYQSAGAYQINLRLEGKNPDLYGGHPIVFNLNIDGSLPELFEAMFITGSFEEAILKQVKSNQAE